MSDTTTVEVPGHSYSLYCRPKEGLHCLVAHVWRDPEQYPTSEQFLPMLRRQVERNEVGRSMNVRRVERATEAPRLAPSEWRAYLERNGDEVDPDEVEDALTRGVYEGPMLYWVEAR